MATQFKLPDLGEGIDSGDVVSILVSVGDTITAEQEIAEIETDKAMLPLPCPLAGKVTKILIAEGQTINIGDPIIEVETEGGAAAPAPAAKQASPKAAAPAPAKAEAPAPAAEKPAAPAPKPAAPASSSNDELEAELTRAPEAAASAPAASQATPSAAGVAASPSTRRLARELGIDISKLGGSGAGGRISREDVLASFKTTGAPAAAAPARPKRPATDFVPKAPPGEEDHDAYGEVRRDKLPKIRQVIARKMVESATTAPHVTNFDDADVTDLEAMRREVKDEYDAAGSKLTSLPFVIKAVAGALKRHHKLNALLDLENKQVVYKEYVNLGIAVDTERGLVVPNIRHADTMTIPEIARALLVLAKKARNSDFKPDDLRGGTFTISNMGAIGGEYSTPIINIPEVAILLLGRTRKMPAVVGDEIKPRLMMPLSLSYDHRLVDGADAARFLNEVKLNLENPSRLLLMP